MGNSAGIFLPPDTGFLEIQGSDAQAFLHRMTSHNVQQLPVGEGLYNALLDRKGMVLSLFYLLRIEPTSFLALLPQLLVQKTATLLNKMKFREQLTISDLSSVKGLLQLVGPQSEKLVLNRSKEILIWREDIFESPVWNCVAAKEKIDELYQQLISQAVPLGQEAMKLLYMKAGFPEYGVDLDETHMLLEVQNPIAYQRNKGCYPGQEVVERILTYGKGRTPRRLCTLFLEGEPPLLLPAEVTTSEGKKIGRATSSGFDPVEQKTFVLAILDYAYVEKASQMEWKDGRLFLKE